MLISHFLVLLVSNTLKMERVVGIEPTFPAWKAGVLPIYDTCKVIGVTGIEPATSWSQTTRAPICATPRSVVYLKGFEPLTHGLEGRCSIQLS